MGFQVKFDSPYCTVILRKLPQRTNKFGGTESKIGSFKDPTFVNTQAHKLPLPFGHVKRKR